MRFSAIRSWAGPLGCTKSHIAVLKMAMSAGWKNVLIMEDDMVWKTKENLDTLKTLIEKPYDVIVLAGTYVKHDPITHKLYNSSSTGAYLVNQSYYKTLLANFEEGHQYIEWAISNPQLKFIQGRMRKVYRPIYDHTIDNFWRKLQPKDNWFILRMFYGLPQYSDVAKDFFDYTSTYF